MISAQIQSSADRPTVVATPGTAAAVAKNLRAQLESGALTQAGQGINAEYQA